MDAIIALLMGIPVSMIESLWAVVITPVVGAVANGLGGLSLGVLDDGGSLLASYNASV